ncbi:MAG TPA: GntR family transcriptional regulator [Gemmatimonadales bacterium]|nr:GntR family transcriptional regulator [Gemmatimonadales bacterium]
MKLDKVLSRGARTPRRQASHEMVASVLREAIATGQLRGNQPLPQDEIASQLRVSHIPVREALRQLESEGLVTYQANRGATVRALTTDEIREIYEIRATLETAAVRRATPLLSADVLAQARQILDQAERARDDGEWGSLDVEFHQTIYDLEMRPRLQELITGLLRRVDRYWLSQGMMLKHRGTFDDEHRALLRAIESRNAEKAAELLGAHLAGASALLVSELESGALEQANTLATGG